MIDLDPTQFGEEIANLLLLSGGGIPPLQFHSRPSRLARTKLGEVEDDARLCGVEQPANVESAAAVRALLYLWNGWPAESATHAVACSAADRLYVNAIRARQAGEHEEAKTHLRKVDRHAIYPGLTAFALAHIGPGGERALQRFRQILELGAEWDPFAFVDLTEQARGGKLSEAAELTVRSLQCKEFELLFADVFTRATGRAPISAADQKEEARQLEDRRRIQRISTRRQRSTPVHDSESTPARPVAETPPASSPRIKVRCPTCHESCVLAESERGRNHRCGKCGTSFLVPDNKTADRPRAEAPTVGILCPKCRQVLRLPESARGQQCTCQKCHATFLVPGKPQSSAAH